MVRCVPITIGVLSASPPDLRHRYGRPVAAGLVLVREAGGIATDAGGTPEVFAAGSIVAGNEAVHGALIANLTATRAAV